MSDQILSPIAKSGNRLGPDLKGTTVVGCEEGGRPGWCPGRPPPPGRLIYFKTWDIEGSLARRSRSTPSGVGTSIGEVAPGLTRAGMK